MNLRFDEIVFERTGQLKLATVIIGIFDLGLAAAGYYKSDTRDQAFLAAVIICFFLSLANVVGSITGRFRPSNSDRILKIDLGYHIVACIFLACCDIAFFISLIKYTGSRSGGKFAIRLFALILGVLNAALYGFIPWRVWKTETG